MQNILAFTISIKVKIHVFNSLVSKEGIVLKDRGSLF
jgi:hypothetical protein